VSEGQNRSGGSAERSELERQLDEQRGRLADAEKAAEEQIEQAEHLQERADEIGEEMDELRRKSRDFRGPLGPGPENEEHEMPPRSEGE
jgi:hypothetical protein